MSGLPDTRAVSISTAGYHDGLGRRSVRFDREVGAMLECLHLRAELWAFEASLRERADAIAALDDERFVRIRSIERGGLGVVVVSELVAGQRLIDVIETRQKDDTTAFGLDAALGFLLQALPALSTLHAASIAHGAFAPARIVVTPSAQVVLLDSIYAAALERLHLNRSALWSSLGIVTSPSAGPTRLDAQADVVQAGMCALYLALGRQFDGSVDSHSVAAFAREVAELAEIRAGAAFAAGVERFFAAALGLGGRQPVVTSDEAASHTRRLAAMIGEEACHAAFADLTSLDATAARTPAAAAFDTLEGEDLDAPSMTTRTARESEPVDVAKTAPMTSSPEPVALVPPPTTPLPVSVATTPEPVASVPPPTTPPPVSIAARPIVADPPVAVTVAPIPEPVPFVTASPTVAAPVSVAPPPATFVPVAAPPVSTPEPIRLAPPPAPAAAAPVKTAAPKAPVPKFQTHPNPFAPPAPVALAAADPYGPPVPLPLTSAPAPPAPLRIRAEPPAGYTPLRTDAGRPDRTLPLLTLSAAAESSPFPWKIAAAAALVLGVGIFAGRAYLPGTTPAPALAAPSTASAAPVDRPKPIGTTGSLVIDSQPSGAKVTLNGTDVGLTPLKLDAVEAGSHSVAITTATATVRRTVRIQAGGVVTLDVPVYSGWVAVFSPIPLDVSAGGRTLGNTETGKILLPPGRHVLTLSNREFGFVDRRTVEIHPGEERALNVEPKGVVNLNAHPWAEVWVDGKKAGDTPIANLQVLLGTRVFVFKHPQYGERRLNATITTATAALSVDFTKPPDTP